MARTKKYGTTIFRKSTRKTKKRRSTTKRGGKRRRTFKRSTVKKKRRGHRGDALRVVTQKLPMNVISTYADRVRTTFDYKMRGQLSITNVAESVIGMYINPQYLGPWSISTGPFRAIWPAAGTNVLFPHSVSSTPGFSSATSRFQNYIMLGSKISVKITRQEAADSTTCLFGLLPLTQDQNAALVLRNTAASPAANNSYLLPQRLLTTTSTMDGLVANAQLMVVKQQPHHIIKSVTMPYSGHSTTYLSQEVSAKKMLPFGYPYGGDYQGALPLSNGPTFAGTTGDGVPPGAQYSHYFWMQRTTAVTPNTEAFDIEIDLKVHVQLHNPYYAQSAPTLDEPGPPDPDPDDYDMDNPPPTPNLSNLSLTTPSHASTCLNPQHPKIQHERVGTCV